MKEKTMKLAYLCYLTVVMVAMTGFSAHALERVASTPYTGASNANSSVQLPACTAGQVLTSLGSNTFTCIDTNATLQTNNNAGDVSNNTTNSGIGLPNCGANQALGVSGGKFVCANIVKNAPKCEDGYGLVGDGQQTLTCVKIRKDPPACGTGQVLTSDQGQFACVSLETPPSCGAGQALTASGGKFSCVNLSATNCNGRLTQNWGGYQYCSVLTCGAGQALTVSDGYPQCITLEPSTPKIMAVSLGSTRVGAGFYLKTYASAGCPAGWQPIKVFTNTAQLGLKGPGDNLSIPGPVNKSTSSITYGVGSNQELRETEQVVSYSNDAGWVLCVQ